MVSRSTIWRRKRFAEDPEYRTKERAARRRYRADHKDEINERRREALYGLPRGGYQALLARQGGVCGICGEQSFRWLCIDHCHSSGKVRGLLCNKCNVILGMCHDDPNILRAAIAYLEAADRHRPWWSRISGAPLRALFHGLRRLACRALALHRIRDTLVKLAPMRPWLGFAPPIGRPPEAESPSTRHERTATIKTAGKAATRPVASTATPPAAPPRSPAAGSARRRRHTR